MKNSKLTLTVSGLTCQDVYCLYIYIHICVCCFSPLVARPHLESTTVIEIQQVYIESCEMILS